MLPTATHTLRMLGDNVTLTRAAWLELLGELRPDSTLVDRIHEMLSLGPCKLATHRGQQFAVGPMEIPDTGQRGLMLDDGTVVTLDCGDHIQSLTDRARISGQLDLRRDRMVVKD